MRTPDFDSQRLEEKRGVRQEKGEEKVRRSSQIAVVVVGTPSGCFVAFAIFATVA